MDTHMKMHTDMSTNRPVQGSMEAFLPPGYRFHPTDEELVIYYLANKVVDNRFSVSAIGEVDLNKCEPWDLPERAKMGEREWYFFSLRDRKYPTGLRTNRATDAGYWKATGKDREVMSSRNGCLVGMKKTLVFYKGRAPKGEKTNWIMHEYRLEGEAPLLQFSRTCKDEWVVCRIFRKNIGGKKNLPEVLRNLSYGETDVQTVDLPPLLESPHTACTEEGGVTDNENGLERGDPVNLDPPAGKHLNSLNIWVSNQSREVITSHPNSSLLVDQTANMLFLGDLSQDFGVQQQQQHSSFLPSSVAAPPFVASSLPLQQSNTLAPASSSLVLKALLEHYSNSTKQCKTEPYVREDPLTSCKNPSLLSAWLGEGNVLQYEGGHPIFTTQFQTPVNLAAMNQLAGMCSLVDQHLNLPLAEGVHPTTSLHSCTTRYANTTSNNDLETMLTY